MEALGARRLASNENQFKMALAKSLNLIQKKALGGFYKIVLPKLSPSATTHVKDALEKLGYRVIIGGSIMVNRGRLIVTW